MLWLLQARARPWRGIPARFQMFRRSILGRMRRRQPFPGRESIRRRFDHVMFGNVLQTSADAIYGARHVGLKAGLKIEVPAVTVNRLCGSGIEAIVQGAQRLLLGEADMVLAGGMENMTQAPFVIRGARTGLKLGGGALEDFLFVGLTDTYCGLPMALTAEKLAEQTGITRKDADAYALRSQQAAEAAYQGRTHSRKRSCLWK